MAARILIIEDNPASLELMSYLLSAFGYENTTAVDGEQGLLAARRESPDLIICDVDIPKINGLDLARRIKSDDLLRDVPLVAVTAFAMVGDRDRVLAAGFDGYIAKPIEPEKFVGQVEEFLTTLVRGSFPVPSEPTIKMQKPRVSHATILVVDNSPVNIHLMLSILEPSGYAVLSACNVDAGLKEARKAMPDLIISDVHMPVKDGYDFLQALKTDVELAHIPFLFLSSTRDDERHEERSIALGAEGFITRPIEPRALLARVEKCLQNRRANRDGDNSGSR